MVFSMIYLYIHTYLRCICIREDSNAYSYACMHTHKIFITAEPKHIFIIIIFLFVDFSVKCDEISNEAYNTNVRYIMIYFGNPFQEMVKQ